MITIKKIENAISLTYENIIDLYETATLLSENNKEKRAYTFYHFSFEETGRFAILKFLLNDIRNGKVKKEELKYNYLKNLGYESHSDKLDKAILKLFTIPMLKADLQNDERKKTQFLEIYESLKKNIYVFDKLKNKSLYICYYDNNFYKPENSITDADLKLIKDLSFGAIQTIKMVYEEFIKNKTK